MQGRIVRGRLFGTARAEAVDQLLKVARSFWVIPIERSDEVNVYGCQLTTAVVRVEVTEWKSRA